MLCYNTQIMVKRILHKKEGINIKRFNFQKITVLFFQKITFPLKSIVLSIKLPLKKHLFNNRNKPVILTALFFALVGEIFFTPGNSDIRFFGFLILFFITSSFYQLKSRVTFSLCLVLLCIMYGEFLLSGPSFITEKVAVWIVLFMVVGIIQQWKE